VIEKKGRSGRRLIPENGDSRVSVKNIGRSRKRPDKKEKNQTSGGHWCKKTGAGGKKKRENVLRLAGNADRVATDDEKPILQKETGGGGQRETEKKSLSKNTTRLLGGKKKGGGAKVSFNTKPVILQIALSTQSCLQRRGDCREGRGWAREFSKVIHHSFGRQTCAPFLEAPTSFIGVKGKIRLLSPF